MSDSLPGKLWAAVTRSLLPELLCHRWQQDHSKRCAMPWGVLMVCRSYGWMARTLVTRDSWHAPREMIMPGCRQLILT